MVFIVKRSAGNGFAVRSVHLNSGVFPQPLGGEWPPRPFALHYMYRGIEAGDFTASGKKVVDPAPDQPLIMLNEQALSAGG
jgi:hypothetical protein